MLTSSRDKNEGTYSSSGEGGGRARYVTQDLSYYWEGAREYHSARKINGMKKKTRKREVHRGGRSPDHSNRRLLPKLACFPVPTHLRVLASSNRLVAVGDGDVLQLPVREVLRENPLHREMGSPALLEMTTLAEAPRQHNSRGDTNRGRPEREKKGYDKRS